MTFFIDSKTRTFWYRYHICFVYSVNVHDADNILFRAKEYVTYKLWPSIKQGLPLSPVLFIFSVNDIFDMFEGIHGRYIDNNYKCIHLLVHADDVTMLAVERMNAFEQLRTLYSYCKLNHIIPQKMRRIELHFLLVRHSWKTKTARNIRQSHLEYWISTMTT